ncbi:MAG: CoA transferase [Rhodospirillaceae bacterium TMED8]|nr:CoA transferase [Magnetovibrio sp.]OUT53209.1 MAG: CoA transferase [Rhodospirillaceae bacterium TMED8]|tara:strand:+ start:1584 stop:2816 length:1233 start_codon:yes stop_codon:yes gene_type:complete
MSEEFASGPLKGLRILDLTRILAGPTCTQLLGDLGADVIKVERPGLGDDTRKWGPPYLVDSNGNETSESAYYLSSNRNKRSITLDIAKPGGVRLLKRLLRHCDILAHNFKVGGLEKYGLGYSDLKTEFPGLIYCAITGFGQTGPYAPRAGYDFLAQGLGGIMSLTGEPDGEPVKVGVGIADVMCGMYATTAILAALHHREKTGQGQIIDVALLDTQVAWLVNEATNYFLSGTLPLRRGNAHPNIVPYQVFPTLDSYFILAVGNDRQFQRFCKFAGEPKLGRDPRFVTNAQRLLNRNILIDKINELSISKTTAAWIKGLSKLGVPSGAVNDLAQTFKDPQILHRGMKISMSHQSSGSGKVDLLGNPLKLSATPVTYRHPPPTMGAHTDEVLEELLDTDENERQKLREEKLI